MDHRPSRGHLDPTYRGASSVPVSRYRYRGSKIPTPWPSTGNSLTDNTWRARWGPPVRLYLAVKAVLPKLPGDGRICAVDNDSNDHRKSERRSFLRRRGPPRPRRTTRLLRLVGGPLGLRGSAGARPGRCIRFCARVAFRLGERHGVQVRPRHCQSRQGVGQSLPKLREIAGQENLEITIEIRRNECKAPLRLSGDAAGLRVARPAESTIWHGVAVGHDRGHGYAEQQTRSGRRRRRHRRESAGRAFGETSPSPRPFRHSRGWRCAGWCCRKSPSSHRLERFRYDEVRQPNTGQRAT